MKETTTAGTRPAGFTQLSPQARRLRQRRIARIRKKTGSFLTKLLLFVMLLGFAYVILYPFFAKITASFMSRDDLYDATVSLVPRALVLDNYKTVLQDTPFVKALLNTLLYSTVTAVCATVSAALVGYGLGRFRFRGGRLLFALVVMTMLIPSTTLALPQFKLFLEFDVFGLFGLILGKPLELTNTIWPMVILSSTCLGFRGGIFVVLMRQYYKNIPNELVEAAYVDGAGHFRTFVRIVLPMARSMLTVVFILAFAWEWTDTFYSTNLMGATDLLSSAVTDLATVSISSSSEYYYYYVLANTALILAIIPLLVIYVIFQRRIIEGIERSGLVE